MSIHNAKFEGQPSKNKSKQKLNGNLNKIAFEEVDAAVKKQYVKDSMNLKAEKKEFEKNEPKRAPRQHELNGKFLHIKVGDSTWDDDMLATEMGKVEEKISALIEGNNIDCLVFVTHYGVEVKLIEPIKMKEGTAYGS